MACLSLLHYCLGAHPNVRGMRVRITTPQLTDLDLDLKAVQDTAEEAARARMRRKGMTKGANLEGAGEAAAQGAEEETRRQLERSDVGGVRHHHETR